LGVLEEYCNYGEPVHCVSFHSVHVEQAWNSEGFEAGRDLFKTLQALPSLQGRETLLGICPYHHADKYNRVRCVSFTGITVGAYILQDLAAAKARQYLENLEEITPS
jgi:hypothetical protein